MNLAAAFKPSGLSKVLKGKLGGGEKSPVDVRGRTTLRIGWGI